MVPRGAPLTRADDKESTKQGPGGGEVCAGGQPGSFRKRGQRGGGEEKNSERVKGRVKYKEEQVPDASFCLPPRSRRLSCSLGREDADLSMIACCMHACLPACLPACMYVCMVCLYVCMQGACRPHARSVDTQDMCGAGDAAGGPIVRLAGDERPWGRGGSDAAPFARSRKPWADFGRGGLGRTGGRRSGPPESEKGGRGGGKMAANAGVGEQTRSHRGLRRAVVSLAGTRSRTAEKGRKIKK